MSSHFQIEGSCCVAVLKPHAVLQIRPMPLQALALQDHPMLSISPSLFKIVQHCQSFHCSSRSSNATHHSIALQEHPKLLSCCAVVLQLCAVLQFLLIATASACSSRSPSNAPGPVHGILCVAHPVDVKMQHGEFSAVDCQAHNAAHGQSPSAAPALVHRSICIAHLINTMTQHGELAAADHQAGSAAHGQSPSTAPDWVDAKMQHHP